MRIPVLASLICLSFAAPSIAQDLPKISMSTFSVVTSFAPPPWSSSEDINETSEISLQQGQTGAGHEMIIWETIPKGESFEDWSKLYAITAEYPMNGDLEKYVAGQANRFYNNCESSLVQYSRTTPDNVKLFVVFCESYKERPDTGEIAVFHMQLHNNTLVKNYYEIRVPKFTLENLTELPFGPDEILNMVSHLSALRLVGFSSD